MKILFITNNLKMTDGWGRYSKDISEEMSTQGNDVCVIVSEVVPEITIRQEQLLLGPEKYLANPLQSYRASRKIQAVIDSFGPDVVHFLVEPYASAMIFLQKKDGIKFFATVHGTYAYPPVLLFGIKKMISKYIFDMAYEKLDAVFPCSNYTARYVETFVSDAVRKKVFVVTNGITTKTSGSEHAGMPKNNSVKRILSVGAIKFRKGVMESIKALKQYHDTYTTPFVYHVVGRSDLEKIYFEEVKKAVKEYGLEDCVVFEGRLSETELQNMYATADLFLMLSIHDGKAFEGFGLVYLEANESGVPCIGSYDCGAEDAIISGTTGFLVDPFNPVEVAEKIDVVISGGVINSHDCVDWAHANTVASKVRQLIHLYKQ